MFYACIVTGGSLRGCLISEGPSKAASSCVAQEDFVVSTRILPMY